MLSVHICISFCEHPQVGVDNHELVQLIAPSSESGQGLTARTLVLSHWPAIWSWLSYLSSLCLCFTPIQNVDDTYRAPFPGLLPELSKTRDMEILERLQMYTIVRHCCNITVKALCSCWAWMCSLSPSGCEGRTEKSTIPILAHSSVCLLKLAQL